MFNIYDYKSIITDYATTMPKDENERFSYKNFHNEFAIDSGFGVQGKNAFKWIDHFNSYRNMWAHEGTKEKTLNKEEVAFLERIYYHFYK